MEIFAFCKDIVDQLESMYGDAYGYLCNATHIAKDEYAVTLELKLNSNISLKFPWESSLQNVYDRWRIRQSPEFANMWKTALISLIEGDNIEEV